MIAVALDLVGGVLLFLGKEHLGAVCLMVFLVPVTLIMHPFWNASGSEADAQIAHFMKNVSIMGALVMILAKYYGQGGQAKRKTR